MNRMVKNISLLCLIFLGLVLLGRFVANKVSTEREFRNDLKESLALYGDWFVRNQTEQGDFNYELDVQTGELVEDYNLVRQAGGLYSLAQAYKYTKNPEYQLSIEKGIVFFENLFEDVENTVPTTRINFNEERKSNAVALFLLALIEYMETSPEIKEEYIGMSEKLANYLLLTQQESGGFFVLLDPELESDYNNGESFLTLIRMYEITGNEKYLEGAQKAADYIILKYSSEEFNCSVYAWAMQGFQHLYYVSEDPKYWDFMRFYTDAYLNSTGVFVKAYFNKEYPNPPKGSFGVFLEGIIGVASIAENVDEKYHSQLSDFIVQSLDYLMTLQIDGPRSSRTSEFELLSGGICYDEICTKQRVDITQHNLSAIYLYLQHIE